MRRVAMHLVKPEGYRFDPGRSLPPEELAQAARDATPIDKIMSKTCKREDTNDRWRLGRK